MRNPVIILIVLFFAYSSCSRVETNSSTLYPHDNLVLLCKTWGFLKYYHPGVGNEKINWDSVLINNIDLVRSLNSQDSLKTFFDSFILSCHKDSTNTIMAIYDSLFYKNHDIFWINDTSVFSKNAISELNCVYQSPHNFNNKYVSKNEWVLNPIFDNDTLFNNNLFPDLNTRLLSLFRYWNIINYYYPYKYLLDTSWDSVLEKFIPIIMEANDTIEYHLAICKLTAMINDNHSFTTSNILERHYGSRFLPVKFQLRESKTVVTETYSDSLARINNLKVGDILLSINDVSIKEIRDSLSQYLSGSRQVTLQNTINYFLNRSSEETLKLNLLRNDTIYSIETRTYPREILSNERRKKPINSIIDTISESIAYIDLSQIKYSKVDSIFSNLLDYEYLILDLRKNCQFIIHDLSNLLFAEKFEFYSVLTAVYEKPGVFSLTHGEKIGPESYNGEFFKGSLVLLIDENTQSIGEFTTMALSQHENSILIGRQTAGADGNISIINLPGGISTIITGIGIYWPDGEPTQRCGISPNIIVNSQLESVELNRDDILIRAINHARNNLIKK